MTEFRIGFDTRAAHAWLNSCEQELRKAAASALNQTAFAVRDKITKTIPSVFSNTVPATRSSILYSAANAGDDISKMKASVFVRYEAANSANPPERWLRAEIDGGERRDKRSERALKAAGLMAAGQQWTLASGAGGSITGPRMVQILSQLRAFGETGFRANANAATTKRLKRKGVLVMRKTGMQYFVARERRSGDPFAIYQLIGPGVVRPILYFASRKPNYQARFHFAELAAEAAKVAFPAAALRALQAATRAVK